MNLVLKKICSKENYSTELDDMKRRVEITNKNRYISSEPKPKSDFYQRWYSKFGDVPNKSIPADEFMNILKEMQEFE